MNIDELDRLYRRLVANVRGQAPQLLRDSFELSRIYQELVPYRTNRRELDFDSNEEYELALMQLLAGLRGYVAGDAEMQQAMRSELATPNPDLTAFRVYATSTVKLAEEPLRALEQQLLSGQASIRSAGGRASAAEAAALAARATESVEATPAAGRVSAGIAGAQAPSLAGAPANAPPEAPPSPSTASRPAASPEATSEKAPARAAPAGATAASDALPVPGSPLSPPRRDDARTDAAAATHRCRYCGGALPEGRRVTFCPSCGHNLTVQHCPACGTELEVEWKFCITCGRDVGHASG